GFDLEPAQSRQFRPGDPLQFTERLGILDHSMGTAARKASICIWSRVSPSYSSALTRKAISQGGEGSADKAPSKKIARRKWFCWRKRKTRCFSFRTWGSTAGSTEREKKMGWRLPLPKGSSA